MKNNILLKTNIFVCTIIIVGFVITSITSYHSNLGVFEKDIEHVSDLVAEGIYYQIDSIFTKPINVSLTMANDNLLKEFLSDEQQRVNDDRYIQSMRDYLYAYREKYQYDSVFLVSTETNRYYHFDGVDRILVPNNIENVWYYDFLNSTDEYSLNIDNDEAGNNEITVFINCKIKNREGKIMGVVGVGFHVDYLQELLKGYEDEFDVHAYLIDKFGEVEVSTYHTGYEKMNLFDEKTYRGLKNQLLTDNTAAQDFWYTSVDEKGYIVTRYIENLNWYLVVENDATFICESMQNALVKGIVVIFFSVALVLFIITAVIRRYNAQIIELTAAREREYYETRQEATKQLYENIYEFDITHNCAVGKATEGYLVSLGIPAKTPYDEALEVIAVKQIKEEYRQRYLDMFSAEHILETYHNGIKSLCYDFLISNDGENYYWMRIMACIYYLSEDNSIRITTYRQNIDNEKKQEQQLFAQMQSDPLTGLYNKVATEERISEIIKTAESNKKYAFLMLDIDNFKDVNDTLGHATGDFVIAQFASHLKNEFFDTEIIGRIGGDEFAVFLQISNRECLEKKAQSLVNNLCKSIITENGKCRMSASIGIAIYPEMGTDFVSLYANADIALYQTKKGGRNGYTVYNSSSE